MRSACESQLCVNKNERTQKDEESNRFFPVFVICCIAAIPILPFIRRCYTIFLFATIYFYLSAV